MAKLAMARKAMSLDTLTSRMRVKQVSTVRHDAEPGMRQHRLKAMGHHHRHAGETPLNDMDLNPFVQMLPKLQTTADPHERIGISRVSAVARNRPLHWKWPGQETARPHFVPSHQPCNHGMSMFFFAFVFLFS